MTPDTPLLASQVVVQVCLFLVAAIAIVGGSLQMYLGQPDTASRLDNVHRFMASVYLSAGVICLGAAFTIRQHGGSIVYWNEPDGHQWEMLTVSYARQAS
ncbi:MAG: hypothetical protein ACR2GP_15055 [Burkholderiaceae bacterium]